MQDYAALLGHDDNQAVAHMPSHDMSHGMYMNTAGFNRGNRPMQVEEPFGLTTWELNWLQSGVEAGKDEADRCVCKACQWWTFLLMVVKGRLFAARCRNLLFLFSEAEAGVHLQGSGLRKFFDIHVGG